MSLHAIANHMAAKGRNGDSMLVHMTPEEVSGLHALAIKHGGELTINPDTGLPEANFLKKLLPTIIGAGLSFIPGVGPLMAAGLVGGFETIRTGDIGRGLSAGLGAYGGAGLAQSLAGAGTGALSTSAGAAGAESVIPAVADGTLTQAAADIGNTFAREQAAQQAVAQKLATASPTSFMSAGLDAVTKDPTSAGTFLKNNAKSLMYAAGPAIMAGANVENKLPQTVTKPGMIRPYSFDPYSGTYTAYNPYEATPVRAAGGGLMGMADGGYNPGDLEFAERSEPVVRMADGGLTPEQARQMVEAQYATIGRTGVGTGANQIDQAGLQGWTDSLLRGDFKAADLGSRFSSAVTDYMAQNPNDQYTQYVTQFRANQPAAQQAPAQQAPAFTPFTGAQINDYIVNNNLDAAGIAAATKQFNVDPNAVINAQNAQEAVSNVYRNVLGRDPDPVGLQYWTNQVTSGQRTGQEMYQEFLKSAQSILGTAGAKEIFRPGISLEDAVKPFAGYSSADKRNIADEWVRNTLGREVTDADRQQQWYKDATSAAAMNTYDAAQSIFGQFQNYAAKTGQSQADALADARSILAAKNLTEADVLAQTGKSLSELVRGSNLGLGLFQASQLNAPGSLFDFNSLQARKILPPVSITEAVGLPGGVSGGGNTVVNDNGTITTRPNIPGIPEGGFTGMGQVKDIYEQGGGSLGYTPYVPTSIADFEAKYNRTTGGSKQAYDYLMGKGDYPTTPYTPTGELQKPYWESVGRIPTNISTKKYLFQDGKYVENPDYVPPVYTQGTKSVGLSTNEVIKGIAPFKDAKDDVAMFDWMTKNNVTEQQLATALGITLSEARARIAAAKKKKTGNADAAAAASSGSVDGGANGGLMGMARGGATSQYNLGDYSDGGRLLRGPGDGVSDSIPASIGNKRPARLADGEFVVPARIVSELGNGSTEAGARKLYAMMDRVQKARRKTTGKSRVATNTRADKYLPA